MMQVEIVLAWPRRHVAQALQLADGATVADALAAAQLDSGDLAEISGYAIFGERATETTPLCDGDRVELLRPLKIDPKQARRRRAARQGTA